MNKLIIILLLIPFYLSATNYYVKSDGNDSNTGLSDAQAWQTLDKISAHAFVAGDTVFLSGELFGTMELTSLTGTSESPIVFTSYGGGKAIIRGSTSLTDWEYKGSNIWAAQTNEHVHQLLREDTVITNGRTPNVVGKYALKDNNYLVTSVSNSQTTFICSDLIGHPDIVGATINMATVVWDYYSKTIVNFNSATGEVTLNSGAWPTRYIEVGTMFYFSNHKNLVDDVGEWYYDSVDDSVFLYSEVEPNNITMCTITDEAIDIRNSDYITIENIVIRDYANDAVYGNNVESIVFDNVDFKYIYGNAIYVHDGADNLDVQNSSFIGINKLGILAYSHNALINNNTFNDIGLVKNFNAVAPVQSSAIQSHGSNAIISNNIITDCGYAGIRYMGENSIVEYNVVKNFNLTWHDGGAIYTYNQTASVIGARNSIVRNNIVHGISGFDDLGYNWYSIGIYCDGYSYDLTILNNTIINCYASMWLHHNRNIITKNNTFYNPKAYGIEPAKLYSDGEITENVYINNLFYTKSEGSFPAELDLPTGADYSSNNIDSNYYYNTAHHTNYLIKRSGTRPVPQTLAEWTAFSDLDINSFSDTTVKTDFIITDTISGNTVANGDVEDGSNLWTNSGGTVAVETDGDNSFIKYSSTSGGNTIRIYTGEVSSDSTYLISFDLKCNPRVKYLLDIREPDNSYLIRDRIYYPTTTWKRFSLLVNPVNDVSYLKINFVSPHENFTVSADAIDLYIDNVKCYSVDYSEKETEQLHYNATMTPIKVLFIGFKKIDAYGNAHDDSITLEPFTSVVFVSTTRISYIPKISSIGFPKLPFKDEVIVTSGDTILIDNGFIITDTADIYKLININK